MTFIALILFVSLCFIGATSPFIVAVLFVAMLLLGSLVVGSGDSFLGLIVFVVYVGGALVLFSYCFILTPLQDSANFYSSWALPIISLSFIFPPMVHGTIYEFYWVSCILVSVGVLLFIVIVCVVALIDFAQGAIRVQ